MYNRMLVTVCIHVTIYCVTLYFWNLMNIRKTLPILRDDSMPNKLPMRAKLLCTKTLECNVLKVQPSIRTHHMCNGLLWAAADGGLTRTSSDEPLPRSLVTTIH